MKPFNIGREVEQEVASFLKKKGYKVLERNFRSSEGEVDIIAEKEKVLIFVEVRSRSSLQVDPLETVSRAKMRRIIKTAAFYLKTQPGKKWNGFQFDVVGVKVVDGEKVFNHVEDAFSLEDAGFDPLWGGFHG